LNLVANLEEFGDDFLSKDDTFVDPDCDMNLANITFQR
jgi:hypothetical protein